MAEIMAKAKSWYSKEILGVWYAIVNASEVPKVGEKYQKYNNFPERVVEKVEDVTDIQTPELKENFWFYQIQMSFEHEFLAVRKPQEKKKSDEFSNEFIGESDSAYLIADTSSGLYRLEFHEDGAYYAKECYGNVEINEKYTKIFSGNNYLKIYDDTKLTYKRSRFLGFEKVDLYMCEDSFTCIIHWHD